MTLRGALVAVVGPSGAGKDTLLTAARAALRDDPRFVAIRRAITRGPDPAGEDHRPVSVEDFAREREAGGFALWWEAHGLLYGIPRAPLEGALTEGRVVLANLSRHILPEADARYPLRVIEVTAPTEALAARLLARGREDAASVARRLARQVPLPPGLDLVTVLNDGRVEDGVARLVQELHRIAAEAAVGRAA
ncbi:phosphonate metabolism protein/1,5-bisphosphokinase (PRPP-forming) PhnN [Roseomonas sp. OT10]|uniref:phosphonate metabolism protein/1,5-bisphosphokinase (PRPP-forming) PhnN n=1 Tax=Roseomonas cutis TaxID=2897332 RepID=UPI001E304C7E|nr:phosphonate metabolism protein/1,5-bisphosphokinase (PRPP-forming) PhnN [Roseomonas sp. OT10]UFN48794.1 phosphonate metabolism protein/1,5-bisphosphokinase (PRPP-forming) PhnN [Roseomonas sp. OT10]